MVADEFWRIAIWLPNPPPLTLRVKSLDPFAAVTYITRPAVRIVGSGSVAVLSSLEKPTMTADELLIEVELIVQFDATRDPPV
jgi:hypothetical protein